MVCTLSSASAYLTMTDSLISMFTVYLPIMFHWCLKAVSLFHYNRLCNFNFHWTCPNVFLLFENKSFSIYLFIYFISSITMSANMIIEVLI